MQGVQGKYGVAMEKGWIILLWDSGMFYIKQKRWYFLILIVANASADVSGDTTSDLAFKNCLFFFKIQLRTPQDIANELLKP